MVFVANPIMHHLFLGIDPTELGQAPFALAVSGALQYWAHDIDIDVNRGARVYLLPCIAGHVGADAAGATLSEGPYRQDRMMLLVDVGTNAEIVLGNRERVVAASSPTGRPSRARKSPPASAPPPAPSSACASTLLTLEPRFRVIGVDKWSDEDGFAEAAKVSAFGICGSAIIEVVAEMYLAGLISEDGVWWGHGGQEPAHSGEWPHFSYLLHDGEQRITVTQNDIRAIQLAKAASTRHQAADGKLASITSRRSALPAPSAPSSIRNYAMVLGLIPDCDLTEVKAVGNAAGTGALMAHC